MEENKIGSLYCSRPIQPGKRKCSYAKKRKKEIYRCLFDDKCSLQTSDKEAWRKGWRFIKEDSFLEKLKEKYREEFNQCFKKEELLRTLIKIIRKEKLKSAFKSRLFLLK